MGHLGAGDHGLGRRAAGVDAGAAEQLAFEIAPGAHNMAADEVMLERASRGRVLLRFYGWATATVSLEPLVGDQAGPPIYLTRHLDRAGLDAYEQDIAALLAECPALSQRVRHPRKVDTIAACLRGVLDDIALVQETRV